MRIRSVCIVFLFLACYAIQAQQSKVLVQNATDNTNSSATVLIKWYSSQIIYKEGVNIYRRLVHQTNWVKLNETPVVRKQDVDPQFYESDPDLEFYVDMIKEDDGVDIPEPVLVLNMVIKSFQSRVYADFLGVYFEDHSANPGESYLYRVQQISEGQETFLGQSDTITAGIYRPDIPVSDFTVAQEKNFLHFDWTVDEERFYGVNLYQSSSDSSGQIRLNKNPIVISEIENDSTGGFSYPTPKFKQTGFKENVAYTFTLAGLGFFGEELQHTDPIEITFGDITPPASPENLTVEQDTMLVRLNWELPEARADIREMKVFRSSLSEGPYEVVYSTATGSNYLDSIQVPGPYYYYVSSFDYSGNEARSQSVFVEIPDQDPPHRPQGLTMEVDTGQFHLQWARNAEPDLKGYLVFRSVDRASGEAGNENVVLLTGDPLTKPEYTQKLPRNIRNEFFYYILAVDSSDNRSLPSLPVSGRMPDITPPEKPVLKTLSYTDDETVISWIQNVDPDLVGYHIYRSDSVMPLNFERLNQNLLSTRVTRYTDRRAAKNTGYLYQLVAVDSAGNLSAPSDALYTYLRSDGPLEGELKLDLKYKKRKKQNVLTWTPPEGDWIGFMVYRGEALQSLRPLTGLLKESIFSYVDRDLEHDQFAYQVRAFDKNGKILKSEPELWEK